MTRLGSARIEQNRPGMLTATFNERLDGRSELDRPFERRERNRRLLRNLFGKLPCWSVLREAGPLAWFQAAFRDRSAAEFEESSPEQVLALESACGLLLSPWLLNALNEDLR